MDNRYYITKSGDLRRKDNTLYFENQKIKRTIPIVGVREIYLLGNININSKLLDFLAQEGVLLHNFNYYGYYSGSYIPRKSSVSGDLIVKQVEHYQDKNKRLCLANNFVNGAAKNIFTVLGHYQKHGVSLGKTFRQLEQLLDELEEQKKVSQILRIEGGIWKVFYNSFAKFLPQNFHLQKRVKRPPDNAINAMISFGNSLLYTKVLSQIHHTHLNPTISYLHEPFERRFSLALDLSEVFKPHLVFKTIFKLINKKMIQLQHFDEDMNNAYLKKKGRRKFLQEFDSRLNKTFKHPKLNRKVSNNYSIRLDCYKIIKHIIEDQQYEPFNRERCI